MDKTKELDLRLKGIEQRLDSLEGEEGHTIRLDAEQQVKIDLVEAALRRFLLAPGNPFTSAAEARAILDGCDPDDLGL